MNSEQTRPDEKTPEYRQFEALLRKVVKVEPKPSPASSSSAKG